MFVVFDTDDHYPCSLLTLFIKMVKHYVTHSKHSLNIAYSNERKVIFVEMKKNPSAHMSFDNHCGDVKVTCRMRSVYHGLETCHTTKTVNEIDIYFPLVIDKMCQVDAIIGQPKEHILRLIPLI